MGYYKENNIGVKMKIIKYGILIILFPCIVSSVFAQSLVAISPAEVSLRIGDTFETYVAADNVNDFFGVSFNFHYDNKYLKLNSVVNDTLLGDDVVFFPNDDNANGILSIGITRKAGQTNINGSGNIIKATFEVVNLPQQDSTIEFTLFDIEANDSVGTPLILDSLASSTLLKLLPPGLNKIYPITPSNLIGNVGSEFDANIFIEDVAYLFGVSFNFNFPNDVFEVLSVQPDTLLGNDVVFYQNIDNVDGIVSIGITKKNGQKNVHGSGVLVAIKLKISSLPLQDTLMSFNVSDIMCNDKDGNTITLIDSISNTLITLLDPPIAQPIPSQTINEGESFTKIFLDDFVEDIDDNDSTLTWNYSGNEELSVSINNRIAEIKTPDSNWFGSENLLFTVSDPFGQKDMVSVQFIVNSINDLPVIEGLVDTITFENDKIISLSLWNVVFDVETSDSNLTYTINSNNDSIVTVYDETIDKLEISSYPNYSGIGTIFIKITDDSSETATDSILVIVDKITGISQFAGEVPNEYVLHQNYPNPFNPSTIIKYGIPEQSIIKIEIFNMLGQSVGVLINAEKAAGYYETIWYASNLTSGIYLIQIKAEGLSSKKNFTQIKKALFLK